MKYAIRNVNNIPAINASAGNGLYKQTFNAMEKIWEREKRWLHAVSLLSGTFSVEPKIWQMKMCVMTLFPRHISFQIRVGQ